MDKMRKSAIKRYVNLALLALVVAGLAALPMLTGGGASENKASLLSAQVQPGSVTTEIRGGGGLEAGESIRVEIPQGVTVTRLLVSGGDNVAAGQPIAEIDPVSVMSRVVADQKTLEKIAVELQKLSVTVNPGAITADDEGNLYSGSKRIPADKLEDYARFVTLSQQHRDFEQELLHLFRMSQTGTVTAESSGMVANLDSSIVKKLSSSSEGEIRLLAVNTPGAEEEDGETYSVCFTALVNSIGAADGTWHLLKDGVYTVALEDFSDLSAVNTNVGFMTVPFTHEPTPVYQRKDGAWEQVESLKSGDILLFAYSESVEWVIKVGSAQPTTPDIPNLPNLPGNLEDLLGGGSNAEPDIGDLSGLLGSLGGSMPSFGNFGSIGGYSGFAQKEPDEFDLPEPKLLCTLVPQGTMTVPISVDERDIGKITPGMTARVTLDALPDLELTGTVTQVGRFGASGGGSSKFTVKLEVPYAEGMLPGMNAAVFLELQTVEDVLTLPVAAITEIGSREMVYTGLDAKTQLPVAPAPVETGLSDGLRVQVSGLEEGMTVYYSYYDTLEISNSAE